MFLIAKCRTVNSSISTKNENCTFSRAACYLRRGLSGFGVPAQKDSPAVCQLSARTWQTLGSLELQPGLIPFKLCLKELRSDFFEIKSMVLYIRIKLIMLYQNL